MNALALSLRSVPTPPRAVPAPRTPPPAADERALARAFAEGRPEAVDAVYRRCLGPVFAYVAARLGDRTEAEDVVQEAFLTALRRAKSFDGRSTLLTWVTGIARNKARERVRTLVRARRRAVAAEEAARALLVIEDAALPDVALRAAETAALVGDALRLLPERHRRTLALKYVEGLALAEIGAREGVSTKAAESAVVRARRGFVRVVKALARARLGEETP